MTESKENKESQSLYPSLEKDPPIVIGGKTEVQLKDECEIVGNPVVDHVEFFTDSHGNLTYKSMENAHAKLGITYWTNVKFEAILNIAIDHNVPPTAKGMAQIVNPKAIGPWRGGKFLKEVFEEIKLIAITYNGKRIITKSMLKALGEKMHFLAKIKDTTATHVGGCFGLALLWGKVTEGSINELFEVFSDFWYLNEYGCYEKALSLDQILLFYTNQKEIYRRKLAGLFDQPKPVF